MVQLYSKFYNSVEDDHEEAGSDSSDTDDQPGKWSYFVVSTAVQDISDIVHGMGERSSRPMAYA